MSGPITRRSFLSLCAWAVLSMIAPKGAWAFERAEHDNITEEILFGRPYKRLKRPGVIKALECAVYLCADQMKEDGGTDLEYLKKSGVPNLPSLKDIALTKDIMKLAGGFFGYHDALTHMGWHFDYSKKDVLNDPVYDEVKKRVKHGYGRKWPKRWKRRKRLLVDSVSHLLDFGFLERAQVAIGWSDGGRCDAFAELLYYIHVLGDYQDKIQDNIKKGKYEMNLLAIPFAVKGASEVRRDLFWDLGEATRILFDNDETADEYVKLMNELDIRAERARESSTVRNKTTAEAFRKNVMMTRRILKRHIPGLLTKSSFFSNVIKAQDEV